MPLDPVALKALSDAGGWAAFLGLGSVIVVAWWRQWFVHGELFRAERSRAEKLVGSLDRNTNVLARLTGPMRQQVEELRGEIEALRTELRLERVRRDRDDRPDAHA